VAVDDGNREDNNRTGSHRPVRRLSIYAATQVG